MTIALAACGPGSPATIAPLGLAPGDRGVVAGWLEPYRPTGQRTYQIRPWRYRNERGPAAGRAVVRISPPDSLRFDYQGPFRKSGKAAVVGSSALWVVPEEDNVAALVTLAPLFWASLGLPQEPPGGVEVYTLETERLRAWRYIVDGDTLNFILRGNPANRLQGEIRRGGRTIGYANIELDAASNFTIKARVDIPIDPSRFEFTVESVDTLATFGPDVWNRNP